MSPVEWFGVLVGLASICALIGVAVDAVLNPPTPLERERTRQAIEDWYGHKNAAPWNLPSTEARTGEFPPSPSSRGAA